MPFQLTMPMYSLLLSSHASPVRVSGRPELLERPRLRSSSSRCSWVAARGVEVERELHQRRAPRVGDDHRDLASGDGPRTSR